MALTIIPQSGLDTSYLQQYDLDDVTYKCDGFTNTFPLKYNQTAVTTVSPFNLMVTVNGLVQPAFDSNYDTVWFSSVLSASKGYCIDISGNPSTNNYIKFAYTPPAKSEINIRLTAGIRNTTVKRYPFKPIDILMGI